MSLIGLPQDYRFAIGNQLGTGGGSGTTISGVGSLAPTIVGRRVRFDTTGSLSYESTTTTFFSLTAAGLSAGSYFAGSSFSNVASGWLGGEFLISMGIAGSSASGSVLVFLETSPDGGTTWPTPLSGTAAAISFPAGAAIVAAIGFGSVASVIANLSGQIMRVNFNL